MPNGSAIGPARALQPRQGFSKRFPSGAEPRGAVADHRKRAKRRPWRFFALFGGPRPNKRPAVVEGSPHAHMLTHALTQMRSHTHTHTYRGKPSRRLPLPFGALPLRSADPRWRPVRNCVLLVHCAARRTVRVVHCSTRCWCTLILRRNRCAGAVFCECFGAGFAVLIFVYIKIEQSSPTTMNSSIANHLSHEYPRALAFWEPFVSPFLR